MGHIANKKELVADLMMKAKQVEYLIQSLPAPEPEEEQVEFLYIPSHSLPFIQLNVDVCMCRLNGCKPSKTR